MAPSKFSSIQQVRSPHKSGRTAHHLTIGCSRPLCYNLTLRVLAAHVKLPERVPAAEEPHKTGDRWQDDLLAGSSTHVAPLAANRAR